MFNWSSKTTLLGDDLRAISSSSAATRQHILDSYFGDMKTALANVLKSRAGTQAAETSVIVIETLFYAHVGDLYSYTDLGKKIKTALGYELRLTSDELVSIGTKLNSYLSTQNLISVFVNSPKSNHKLRINWTAPKLEITEEKEDKKEENPEDKTDENVDGKDLSKGESEKDPIDI